MVSSQWFSDAVVSRLIIECTSVAVLTTFAAFFSPKVLRLVGNSAGPSWLAQFALSLRLILPLMVSLYGVFFLIEVLSREFPLFAHPERVAQARSLVLVIFISWLALRWKEAFATSLAHNLSAGRLDLLDQSAVFALSKLASILIMVMAGVMMLDIVGVPVSTILAFGGIGGLAVSWAAKDVVANFFGGLMIYVNRPFAVGDWIKSVDKNFEGVVEDIGWYRTQIRSVERRPTYIPNALITEAIVENPGRMYNRRIKADLAIRHEDSGLVPDIVRAISHLLDNHREVDHNQLRMVHLTELTTSALIINIYCFTKATDWIRFRDAQQEILLAATSIVRDHGAKLAIPIQRVMVDKNPLMSP